MSNKINLLGLSRQQLTDFVVAAGEKPFKAKQLFKWIYARGITDFNLMSDLSKLFREYLIEHARVEAPKILSVLESSDGTKKFLFDVGGGSAVETVYIPEPSRATLCVSSQVGCLLSCTFCYTAKQGFHRNLEASEIIGQLWYVSCYINEQNAAGQNLRPVSNIVFMGMGEPLLNLPNVLSSMNIMIDDDAYGLSKRRVTLSTSGVVPALYEMMDAIDVSLAISLHAPEDKLRDVLVPINKKHKIDELMKACQAYIAKDPSDRKRHVTIEYVMLDGVNDTPLHARQLKNLLHSYSLPVKVNLIPFNSFEFADYKRSSDRAIQEFCDILKASDIFTFVRKTRGDDTLAACGQLAGDVKDRTLRQARWKTRTIPVVTNPI